MPLTTPAQRWGAIILAAIALGLGGYLIGSHVSETRNAELEATRERQLKGVLNPLEQKLQSFDIRLGQATSQMVTPKQLDAALADLTPTLRKNIADALKKYGIKPTQVNSTVGNVAFQAGGTSQGPCDATKGTYSFSAKPGSPGYAVVTFAQHCTPAAAAQLTMKLKTRFDSVVLSQDPNRVGFLKSNLNSISLTDVDGNPIAEAVLDPSSSFRYTPDTAPPRIKRLIVMGTYSNTGYGVGAYWRLKTWPILVGAGYERGQAGNKDRVYAGLGVQF